jgi:hypothetical protein
MASKKAQYDSDYIRAVNKTYRARGATSGASGARAVVPRIVTEMIPKSAKILDFGAGTEAIHARNLRLQGYNVSAYDIGDNLDPAIHDRYALRKKWDAVYASNVMNVQPSRSALIDLVSLISGILVNSGTFIGNYPTSPRKSGVSVAELESILHRYFSVVTRIKGISSPTWICKRR